jgi:uncharacterized MAPEG superfamily protein
VLDTPALKLYALVASLVALHLASLGVYTGAVRARVKKFVNPEDAKTFRGGDAETEHPGVQRAQRAHRNAIEAAVPFFAVGFLYAASGPSTLGAQAYFFTFLGARVVHSIVYLAGKQPWRTLAFAVGLLTVVGMAVRVIRVSI